jgi:hypothetical protein
MNVDHDSYSFTYPVPVRDDRTADPSRMRDGLALTFLSTAVAPLGYRYRGAIFNFPPNGRGPSSYDGSDVSAGSLIIQPTRPPMNDGELPDRKKTLRSCSELEKRLFKGPLARWFIRCSRVEIVLTDAAARVSPAIAERQSLLFYQNRAAHYRTYGSPQSGCFRHFNGERLTAAFLVHTEQAWPGGPGYLVAFGMRGIDTLVWCYLLATRYAHLLCTTPFVMAELRTGDCPERIDTMAFADSWEATILGQAPHPSAGPLQAA